MRRIFFFVCIIASVNVHAQDTIGLNPVTITATRLPQKLSETGRSITVVPGKMFQQLPVNSIDELLKYVPGVEVQSRGPMGSQSDIVMRGGTFQQVLVLLDGVKLNDPLTGHFSSYIPVTPSEIERIEVLRGPAAAIYGAEAVGGVINIVTKTFNQFKTEKSKKTNIDFLAGEYRFVNAAGSIYNTGNKINYSAGFFSSNTTGQLLRGNNRGFLHNHTITGSAAIALKNNTQLSFRSSFDSRDFSAQNFYTTFKSDTATEKVTTWWNQVQLKRQTEKQSRQMDILYKQTSDHYVYNSQSVPNDNKANHLIFQLLQTQKLKPNFNFSFGAQVAKRSIVSNDRGNHTTHNGGLFGTLLYSKGNFRIAPGLRFELDENFGAALLPQLNTSYQLKQVTLRGNIGKAIRSADFTERFNNYNKSIVTGGSIGNPNLDTENSWSFETGADAFFANAIKASVSLFYRDQNNVIDFVTTPYTDMPRKDNLVAGSIYALAKNIKRVKTSGIELELIYQKVFSNVQQLFINTGVTLLKSESSDSIPSIYIISHARRLMQTNIVYTSKKWSISGNFIYKKRGSQNATAINASLSKTYFLCNAKINYKVLKIAGIFIAVNNITDLSYSDLLGSVMPGRWTTAGVNIGL